MNPWRRHSADVRHENGVEATDCGWSSTVTVLCAAVERNSSRVFASAAYTYAPGSTIQVTPREANSIESASECACPQPVSAPWGPQSINTKLESRRHPSRITK